MLTQSVAIMEYLAETRSDCSLLPATPSQRAQVVSCSQLLRAAEIVLTPYTSVQVRQLTELICSGIQPVQNLAVMQKLSSEQSERSAWSRHWITAGFLALETHLAKTAGLCDLLTSYRVKPVRNRGVLRGGLGHHGGLLPRAAGL